MFGENDELSCGYLASYCNTLHGGVDVFESWIHPDLIFLERIDYAKVIVDEV